MSEDGLYQNFADGPRVYSIDPGRPFLQDLALGLLARVRDDLEASPFALADITVFLPTRRAARAMSDAFSRIAPGETLLLPKIRTLGDLDEDELLGLDTLNLVDDGDEARPAASSMERLVVLSRLVAARESAMRGTDSWPVSMAAARELAKLLDSFYTEEIPVSSLRDLAPAEYARHWAQSIEFLDIAMTAWPAYLDEVGRIDPTARRIASLKRQAEKWRQSPPTRPVVLAGSTGSTPAVRALAQSIIAAPFGCVILPGVDRHLDVKGWETIDDPHPQSGLKQFLQVLGLDQTEIGHWPTGEKNNDAHDDVSLARASLLSLALRPADATDDWRVLIDETHKHNASIVDGINGLQTAVLRNTDEEAATIAMRLRETLAIDGRTAMFVTANRDLARRVSLKMKRWAVDIDDSGGIPLANAPLGVFLRLVGDWLEAPDDPVLLLALLRNPFTTFGLSDAALTAPVNRIERALRDIKGNLGFDRAHRILVEKVKKHDTPAVSDVLDLLKQASAATASGFDAQLDRHLAAINLLNGGAVEPASIWRTPDGETVASFLQSLRLLAPHFDHAPDRSYADIVTELMRVVTLRGITPGHPRISILGPLEARLQSADLVILGGLNEGDWPADSTIDPFLSRPMRAQLGLPSPERRLGLAARDFAELANAPCVFMTRASESGGEPTKPSRWFIRLQNILGALNLREKTDRSSDYQSWAIALDGARSNRRRSRPAPTPPVAARPRSMYVTTIEKWLRDPYAVYAKSILRLPKLKEPGESFSLREFGSIMHAVYEYAARHGLDNDDAIAGLWRTFNSLAPSYGFDKTQQALNQVAIDRSFQWFVDFHETLSAHGTPLAIEGEGKWEIPDIQPAFTISARADRIDRRTDGSLYLIDYKLGQLKSAREARAFSPQLPLIGLIAAHGGFTSQQTEAIAGYAYERLINRTGNEKTDTAQTVGSDVASEMALTREHLTALIKAFDDPAVAYLPQPRPQFTDDYGDYDQLSRRGEWSLPDSGDEDTQ